MVVNNERQLCNKLILFAHCLATGIETSQGVAHLCSNRIRQAVEPDITIGKQLSFSALACDRIRGLELFLRVLSQILNKTMGVSVKRRAKTIEESRIFIEARFGNFKTAKFHLIDNWYFRNPDALFRHKEIILKYLEIKKAFAKNRYKF